MIFVGSPSVARSSGPIKWRETKKKNRDTLKGKTEYNRCVTGVKGPNVERIRRVRRNTNESRTDENVVVDRIGVTNRRRLAAAKGVRLLRVTAG